MVCFSQRILFKADEFAERGEVGLRVAKTRAPRETIRLKSKLRIAAAQTLSRVGLSRPRPARTGRGTPLDNGA